MYLNLYNRITPSVLLWTPATKQVNFCTKAQRILYPEFTHAHLQHPRQIIKLNQLSLKDPFIFCILSLIIVILSLYSCNYSITLSPCSYSITRLLPVIQSKISSSRGISLRLLRSYANCQGSRSSIFTLFNKS